LTARISTKNLTQSEKKIGPKFFENIFGSASFLDSAISLRHIRFHDLRHSCASFLLANGFNLKDAQEWLGHSDIATTANVYAHLDLGRKCAIASGFEGKFTQGTQG